MKYKRKVKSTYRVDMVFTSKVAYSAADIGAAIKLALERAGFDVQSIQVR